VPIDRLVAQLAINHDRRRRWGAAGPELLIAGFARTDASTASLMVNLELAATVVLAAGSLDERLGRNHPRCVMTPTSAMTHDGARCQSHRG